MIKIFWICIIGSFIEWGSRSYISEDEDVSFAKDPFLLLCLPFFDWIEDYDLLLFDLSSLSLEKLFGNLRLEAKDQRFD